MGREVTVKVFPFRVTKEFDEWPESSIRQRKWVSIGEAAQLVDLEGLRKILIGLPDILRKRDLF